MKKYTLFISMLLFLYKCISDSDDDSTTIEKFTDFHGNTYNSARIVDQIWTTENLMATSLNDTIEIPVIKLPMVWETLTTPGCYAYIDNSDSTKKYGYLYNYFAMELIDEYLKVNSEWRIPTDVDWYNLEKYLKEKYPSTRAKSIASKNGWMSSDGLWDVGNKSSLNNVTGLSMLPAGKIDNNGFPEEMYESTSFWLLAEGNEKYGLTKSITYDADNLFSGFALMQFGYSIRLVKDM